MNLWKVVLVAIMALVAGVLLGQDLRLPALSVDKANAACKTLSSEEVVEIIGEVMLEDDFGTAVTVTAKCLVRGKEGLSLIATPFASSKDVKDWKYLVILTRPDGTKLARPIKVN